jgi:hypothetical protein
LAASIPQGVFYERPPYRNTAVLTKDKSPVTRFIAIADQGNAAKHKVRLQPLTRSSDEMLVLWKASPQMNHFIHDVVYYTHNESLSVMRGALYHGSAVLLLVIWIIIVQLTNKEWQSYVAISKDGLAHASVPAHAQALYAFNITPIVKTPASTLNQEPPGTTENPLVVAARQVFIGRKGRRDRARDFCTVGELFGTERGGWPSWG